METPILYSFRRCPYAMRARMALRYSKVSYEHREISLRNRPKSLYDISSKGTVPVLCLINGPVIDESIDVMKWAVNQKDPDSWYKDQISEQNNLINQNDSDFKFWLDRYKYHVRYPEDSFENYQTKVRERLLEHNLKLEKTKFLLGDKIKLVDIAVMPFIRQAAHVNLDWFNNEFSSLAIWLEKLKASTLFLSIMHKYEVWDEGNKGIKVGEK